MKHLVIILFLFLSINSEAQIYADKLGFSRKYGTGENYRSNDALPNSVSSSQYVIIQRLDVYLKIPNKKPHIKKLWLWYQINGTEYEYVISVNPNKWHQTSDGNFLEQDDHVEIQSGIRLEHNSKHGFAMTFKTSDIQRDAAGSLTLSGVIKNK